MMTAPPMPSPAISLPAFQMALCSDGKGKPYAVIDYRTKPCVPYYVDGRYFDDFAHSQRFERYILGGHGLPTPEEQAENIDRERVRSVARSQPWEPDWSGNP